MRLAFPLFHDNRDDDDHSDDHDNAYYNRVHTLNLLSLITFRVWPYLFRFFTKTMIAITTTTAMTTPTTGFMFVFSFHSYCTRYLLFIALLHKDDNGDHHDGHYHNADYNRIHYLLLLPYLLYRVPITCSVSSRR